jgi:hypothetical protein
MSGLDSREAAIRDELPVKSTDVCQKVLLSTYLPHKINA